MNRSANDYWQSMLGLVDRHGWAIAGVLSDGVAPPFSYTIGLCSRGLPDLLIVGVGARTAQSILNTSAAKLIEGFQMGEEGVLLPEVANLPLAPRAISLEIACEYALGAARFAAERGFALRMFHLVIPDAQGLFPWQENCDDRIRKMQLLKGQQWGHGGTYLQ